MRENKKEKQRKEEKYNPEWPSIKCENKGILLLIIILILTFMTLFSFWGAKDNSFVNMDDDVYVTDNERVKKGINLENIKWSFSTIYFGFYYPFTWLSHMLDSELYGLNAGGHHITSVIIHIINTLLLFFVLYRMTGKEWRSFIVAGLFAVHPLHVESVVWISERKDILSALFFFLGLLFYSYYVEKVTIGRYILVLVSYLFGLMSKPMVITFPFVLLLLDYWPLKRINLEEVKESKKKSETGKILWSLVKEKIPMFALIPLFSFLTFYAQKKTGAVADIVSAPISQRILNAIISYARYLGKMIVPVNLLPYYPFPMKKIPVAPVILSLIILSIITYFVFLSYKKRKYLLVGWFWFLGMLVPVIGIVQIGGQAMADRYTYIPLIGIFVIIVFLISDVIEKRRLKIALSVLCAAMMVLLITLTVKQVKRWRDSSTLFSYTLSVDRDNFFAHNSLGSELLLNGKTEEAVQHFLEAIKSEPGYFSAHFNLASAYMEMGKFDEAIEHYKLSFIEKEDAGGFNNIGYAFIKLKKYEEAVKWLEKAIALDNALLDARMNLAKAYRMEGRISDAIKQYEEVLKLKPDFTPALNQIGLLFVEEKRFEEATEKFKKCVTIKPESEEYLRNYGKALNEIGKSDEALKQIEKALKINPDSSQLLNDYGLVLAKMGKMKEAAEKFEMAVFKDPDFLDGHINLGFALLQLNDFEGAITNFKKALTIDPQSELARSNYEYALKGMRNNGSQKRLLKK